MAEETQVVNDAPVESVEKKEEAVEKKEETAETPKAETGDDSTTAVTADGKEQVTIFHNKDNFSVKHPLMNKWTLWFTKPPSGKGENNWADSLKEVVTFDSVEEFWGIYNNITKTSELAQKSDYHLFKAGIRPEWEDVQNKHGGKWAFQFKKTSPCPIDQIWLHVMLAAIGETLEPEGEGEVMGVVVNVRKGMFRVGLWTRTVGGAIRGTNGGKSRTADEGKAVLAEIGKRFKDVLGLPKEELVEFTGHTEAAHHGSTRAKARFTV
ncbi:eukaryotic translation initiation factor 4E [Ascobolus immersus RN42]|uniref:Eukaryotic translation initiation factor 4E n=1 Tax=Ascobolus immersus RN42 TaxID=1160509 RepID=A0A3N4ICU6_ASCIM|nr:eukaryotic translation initiation factor 4E [Ascobolus immersus RN42]